MNRHASRLTAMLRRWCGRGARDRELDAELESFLLHDIDDRIASGMTPGEARRTALAAIGGLQHVREYAQEARMGAALEALARDTRHAVRMARRSPGLSMAIVGSLAIGIAVTIVAYAFIDAWMFKDSPGLTHQDRLFNVELRRLPAGRPPGNPLDSSDDFAALGTGLAGMGDVAAVMFQRVALQLPEPRAVFGMFVSANYFDVLGVRAPLGRVFRPDDNTSGAAVALISHRLWRTLGSDPLVIGRSIRADGQIVQVIGVTPKGFAGSGKRLGQDGADIWLPLALSRAVGPASAGNLRRDGLSFVARLRPGVDAQGMAAAANVIASRRAAEVASQPGSATVTAVSMLDPAFRKEALLMVMAIPVLVLALACANAASLTLARSSHQRRDVAIRLAIGASRGRVVRHLLIESLVLAAAATVVALPLACIVLTALEARLSLPMPIDAAVFVWTLATAVGCAVASGLDPAFRVTARAPLQALSVSRGATQTTPSASRGTRVILVAQIALSIGVLVAGTQLITMIEGQGGTGGTAADRLLMTSFDLDQLRFRPEESAAFYQRLLDGAARVPDAETVALARQTSVWTFGRGKGPGSMIVWVPGRQSQVVLGGYAGGNLFSSVGLPLREGRIFTAADRLGPPSVAIVNQTYAEQFPDRRAVGRTLRVATWRRQSDEEAQAEARTVTIVGVVESAGEKRYTRDGRAVAKIYVPSPLGPEPALTLYVRTRGPAEDAAPAIRQLVADIDPRVPIGEMGSLESFNERSMGPALWLTRMSVLLGLVALALAAAGLFASVSYGVAQRASEFAIRMALGAQPRGLLALVLGQSMRTVSVGFLIGGSAALAVTRLIATQFPGSEGLDMSAFAKSSALLAGVMLVASAIPAMRAAGADPLTSLKDG